VTATVGSKYVLHQSGHGRMLVRVVSTTPRQVQVRVIRGPGSRRDRPFYLPRAAFEGGAQSA